MIKTIPGGIPSDITVRLRKIPVAVTIHNSFFNTITDAVFALSCGSNYRGSVTGSSKGRRINQPNQGTTDKNVAYRKGSLV